MFSWKHAQERALNNKIKRWTSLLKSKNPDAILAHPDWARDIETNTVPMKKALKELHENNIKRYEQRANKLRSQ